MLSQNLQSILDNRLRYMPDITKNAIASIDWADRLVQIGHTSGLHVDEIEDLQSVVLRSMTGMIAPNDFESSLIAALALSPANAEKMIREINAQIFEPIHDFVMSGGKPADTLSRAGISIEPNLAEKTPTAPTPTMETSTQELVLPTQPTTKSVAPASMDTYEETVSSPRTGKFSDFFGT